MGNGISSKLKGKGRSQPASTSSSQQQNASPQGPSSAADTSRHAHVDSILETLGTLDGQRVAEVLASRGFGQEANVRLAIAVDFTKSNEWTGKNSFGGRSLHWLPLDSSLNPYEQTIRAVGTAMERFFDRANGNKIPCYGFGDVRTQDRDVFSFVPDASCKVPGLQDVLEEYRQITREVRMAGPTSFAPAIYQAMRSVYKSGNKFHVLVLVADGLIARPPDLPLHLNSVQEQESIEAIVSASCLPLSIVIVGIGDGPWEAMQGFERKLPKRSFNNFHFVNGTDILLKPPEGRASESPEQREARLALYALYHVPDQFKAAVKLKLVERPVDSSYRRLLKAIRPPLAPPGSELSSLHSQSSLSSAGSTPTISARPSETGFRSFASTSHSSFHEPGPITITISATPSGEHSKNASQAARPKIKDMHLSGSLSEHQGSPSSSRQSPKSAPSTFLPEDAGTPSTSATRQPSGASASEAGPSSRTAPASALPAREERASKQTYAPPAVPSRLSRSAKYSTVPAADGAGPSRALSTEAGPSSRSGPLRSRLSVSGKAGEPSHLTEPLPSIASMGSVGPQRSAPPGILTKQLSTSAELPVVHGSRDGGSSPTGGMDGEASSSKGSFKGRPSSARSKPPPSAIVALPPAAAALPTSSEVYSSSPKASPRSSPTLGALGGAAEDEDTHAPAAVCALSGGSSSTSTSNPQSPRAVPPPQQQQGDASGTCEISPA